MSCAFATWLWLFHAGSTVGFGSRKEILVDRAGDMQSIFEKIRSNANVGRGGQGRLDALRVLEVRRLVDEVHTRAAPPRPILSPLSPITQAPFSGLSSRM